MKTKIMNLLVSEILELFLLDALLQDANKFLMNSTKRVLLMFKIGLMMLVMLLVNLSKLVLVFHYSDLSLALFQRLMTLSSLTLVLESS